MNDFREFSKRYNNWLMHANGNTSDLQIFIEALQYAGYPATSRYIDVLDQRISKRDMDTLRNAITSEKDPTQTCKDIVQKCFSWDKYYNKKTAKNG